MNTMINVLINGWRMKRDALYATKTLKLLSD